MCVCVCRCAPFFAFFLSLFSLTLGTSSFSLSTWALYFGFDEREIFLRTVRFWTSIMTSRAHMVEITILGNSELSPVFLFYFLFSLFIYHMVGIVVFSLFFFLYSYHAPPIINRQTPPKKRFPFGIECTAAPPPDSSCSISLPRLLRR